MKIDDYVLKLEQDLRKRLDRLCWMHNEPALHVTEHFAELKRQVDLDAEQLISEIQLTKRETGKAPKDSDVNETRLEFIRILEELEKRTGLQPKPQNDSSDVYAFFEQRIDAFKDSSSSLDDLEDLYVQLAQEITAETDRVEKRILGEQTIIYCPSKYANLLGSLVYFGEVFLNRQEIKDVISENDARRDKVSFFSSILFDDEDYNFLHVLKSCSDSFLVPSREFRELSKSKQVVAGLAKNGLRFFIREPYFYYLGLCKEEYTGYSAEGSKVKRVFFSYRIASRMVSQAISSDTCLNTSTNLFENYLELEWFCLLKIQSIRLTGLHVNLLPSPATRLTILVLVNVHFESFDTNLLTTCTNLEELWLLGTSSKSVKIDLSFLGALRKLAKLELTLSYSPSDLSVLHELTELRSLRLEGSSCFYADKLPKLSKGILKQILSVFGLLKLNLSCFDIETIDREMFRQCRFLHDLVLERNHIGRATKEDTLMNLDFPRCSEIPSISTPSNNIKYMHNGLRALNAASFAGMTGLRELWLTGNSIVDLTNGVFDNLTSLDRLELDKNKIRRISTGVFDKLTRLVQLTLGGNPIESIEVNAFFQLNNLIELTLQRCRLKSIDSEMFNGLKSLWLLNLSNNLIERIEVVTEDGRRVNVVKADLSNEEKELIKKHLFKDLFGLNWLRLSGNKLEKLDLNCFSKLKRLRKLDLSSNMINELKGEIGSELLPELGEIELTDNQLTTIDQRALPATLSSLFISKNRLKRLDEDFFVKFKKLIYLNLSQNELTLAVTDVTFASFRHCLERIDLSQNESIRVTEGAFAQMPHLFLTDCDFSEHFAILPRCKTLRIRKLTPEVMQKLHKLKSDEPVGFRDRMGVYCLSNCSIKALKRNSDLLSVKEMPENNFVFNLSSLPHCPKLYELDLSRNLIETLEDPDLFVDFESINRIILSGNRLKSIHRGIFKCLPRLERIDLSGNNLSSIDMGLFRHLNSLKHLNISSNGISFLNLARLFRICPDLESLNIADNQLDDRSTAESIDQRSSCYLEKLVLANNRLEKMDFVRDMTFLQHLDLRGNRIESVMSNEGENLLGRLHKLTHLDLSRNRIRSLKDEMFTHLRGKLEYLDISQNTLDALQLDSVLNELI